MRTHRLRIICHRSSNEVICYESIQSKIETLVIILMSSTFSSFVSFEVGPCVSCTYLTIQLFKFIYFIAPEHYTTIIVVIVMRYIATVYIKM